MGFKKGQSRPAKAGRKAGSLNKRQTVEEICRGMGLEPFKAMAEIAQQEAHPRQFDALKELCMYIEPKKKHSELADLAERGKITIEICDYGKSKPSPS
jgi:hypothetical protein